MFAAPIYTPADLARRDLGVLSPATLSALYGLSPQASRRTIQRLVRQGLVAEIERGKYVWLGFAAERTLSQSAYIANQLVNPSYVSYWTALHNHSLTTQVPQAVFCATTRRKKPLTFRDQVFRYVTVRPSKFFGFERVTQAGLPVQMADLAKTLVDSLDQPRYAGGLAEISSAIQRALPDLDVALIVEYATRMQDLSLCSRLGFLLEYFGASPGGRLPASNSPVALDPARPRRGRLNRRWRIVVNLDLAAIVGDRAG